MLRLALVLPLVLAACVHTQRSGEPYSVDQPIPLAVGQTATLDEGEDIPVRIRLDEVVEDSRCPQGVECVWEGEVTVALTLFDGDGGTHDLRLTLPGGIEASDFPDERGRVAVMAWEVHLLSVSPYPREGAAPAEPQATVRFQRLQRGTEG